jgi:hypothetical protein
MVKHEALRRRKRVEESENAGNSREKAGGASPWLGLSLKK